MRSVGNMFMRAALWCSRLRFPTGILAVVPVEDLLAIPVNNTLELVEVLVNRLKIIDPEWLAADVGMDRQRQDLRAMLALLIEPGEAIDGALEQMIAVVV